MSVAPRVRLRVAPGPAERDAEIGRWLADSAGQRRAVLVEGLLFDRPGPGGVPLVGLIAGCPCCVGILPLRVTLARTVRRLRPDHLLLLVASAEHLPRLRRLLDSGGIGVRFEVEP